MKELTKCVGSPYAYLRDDAGDSCEHRVQGRLDGVLDGGRHVVLQSLAESVGVGLHGGVHGVVQRGGLLGHGARGYGGPRLECKMFLLQISKIF